MIFTLKLPKRLQLNLATLVFAVCVLHFVIAFPPKATAQIHFDSPEKEVHFDPATGLGSFELSLNIEDFPGADPYLLVRAFSMGASMDENLLTITDIQQTPLLSEMNQGLGPDFWAPTILADGFTLGVLFSFFGAEDLEFYEQEIVVELSISIDAGLSTGDMPFPVDFQYSNLMSPSPSQLPIVNLVSDSDGYSHSATTANGVITATPHARFIRGDTNSDGTLNLVDVLNLLSYLFSAGEMHCLDAANANNDTSVNLQDAIFLLSHLFVPNFQTPEAPFPSCGQIPLDQSIGCAQSSHFCL